MGLRFCVLILPAVLCGCVQPVAARVVRPATVAPAVVAPKLAAQVKPAAEAPALPPAAPAGAGAVKVKAVVVGYQPEDMLAERVGDAGALKDYERLLKTRIGQVLEAAPAQKGFQAAVVVAVKPGGLSHAWVVSRRRVPDELVKQLDDAAAAVKPVDVQGGPIALAIVFDAFGGGGPAVVDKAHPIPIPADWRRGGEMDEGGTAGEAVQQ